MEGGTRNVRQVVSRMRRMRHVFGVHTDAGFTIVEVLIVFAVTGILFLSAVALISGRQNQAAFNQAIQQMQSQVQQIINEVSVGYYPNAKNFQCTAGATGPIISSGSSAQGTNSGCIFVGKAIQFQVLGTKPEQYAIFTIAGLQKNTSGQDVQSLTEADPTAVAPSTAQPSLPDQTTVTTLQSGLTTYKMTYNNGGADIPVGAVAFVNSFASYSGGTITSGSQQISVVPVATSAINTNRTTAADAINTNLAASVVNPTSGVSICFASGGTNQSGLLTIGGNGHPLAVTLTIKGNKTCT
ncbi:MAG TPA: prepilin-type N-terminal cleavage/methylation domain-containing protein [Candidatus Saccharimonadales bacterium]|nr:prepilin-type N-terminal cleavage/methylation domain-containing protein [Candidatus Saccharimonadales bacterium]